MPTIFKTPKRTFVVENIVFAQLFPHQGDIVVLYPANTIAVQVQGEEAKKAVELMMAAGFVGDNNRLINLDRLTFAVDDGTNASLHLEGHEKVVIVSKAFMNCLEEFPLPETTLPVQRKRKKASS